MTDIHFSYAHGQPLFEGVNLSIAAGESFGLVGPNGSGKTTLISIIAGVLQPKQGTVRIDGRSYADQRTEIHRTIAVVPQDLALYPDMSVRENLTFFQGLYPQTVDRADTLERAIELTRLHGYTDVKAATLSGGLKRRLNLAIGLINAPSLLILDEPTVGIDPQSRRFILDAINTLNEIGTTVLYTSHYLDEVEYLCQRAAIIDGGRILVDGKISALLADTQNATVTFDQPVSSKRQSAARPVRCRPRYPHRRVHGIRPWPGRQ